ncbi:hypothetical protein F4677DRAFT_438909 [Hypoxylon crocopeplum]|nr:hypothetical protein F4677DRAFT_438909 [Hypoxylon crocopeplum]
MASTTSSNSSPEPTSPSNSDSSSGLPVGSIVGITIGTTVGIMVLAAFAFWFYEISKRKLPVAVGSSVPQMEAYQVPTEYHKPELPAATLTANDQMRLYGQFVGPAELHTERGPYKLGGHPPR